MKIKLKTFFFKLGNTKKRRGTLTTQSKFKTEISAKTVNNPQLLTVFKKGPSQISKKVVKTFPQHKDQNILKQFML